MAQVREILLSQNLKDLADRVSIHSVIPDLVVISGTGSSEVPVLDKVVVVSVGCATAVLRGANVFAPGVLGVQSGVRKGEAVSVFADLRGTCLAGFKPTQEQLQQGGEAAFRHLGNGTLHLARWQLFSSKSQVRKQQRGGLKDRQSIEDNTTAAESPELQQGQPPPTTDTTLAVEMTAPVFPSPSFQGRVLATFFPQNLPSTLVGHILDPRPGERVVDMCAAPGGKTTHLALLMRDTGTVVALDAAAKRVEKLQQNVARYRLTCIRTFCRDATNIRPLPVGPVEGESQEAAPVISQPSKRMEGEEELREGSFDRVLLDAPCSALGQRPCLHNTMGMAQLRGFPHYQRVLLRNAVYLLKPQGGTLVYSTCTITPEENEEVVSWALRTIPGLRLVSQDPFVVGRPGLPGFGLDEREQRLVQRFDPTDPADTIGFFVAKFQIFSL